MEINKKICSQGGKNNPGKNLSSIEYITIHNTGNYSSGADAKSHANYLYGGKGESSWHYTVDKKEIWQSFLDENSCWHTGAQKGNNVSIGIEICVNDKNGFKDACKNTAWLTSELMRKHNIPIEKVVQHNFWSGKNCPAELRSGSLGVTWNEFIEMVTEYLNTNSTTSYTVQVGVYKQRENAEKLLNKLSEAGFNGFIKCDKRDNG